MPLTEQDMLRVRQFIQKMEAGLLEGMQVFITYHDSNLGATPSNPTGDGSAGGWHVLSTANSRWFSTKSALNVNGGTWSDPVRVFGFISIIPVNLSDCVGYWKLNDDAANTLVADSSGHSHHGAASADTDTFNDTGKVNGCLDMGGAKYVTVSDHADFSFAGDTAFSIAVDVYVTATAAAQTILAKANSVTAGEWLLRLNASEEIELFVIDDSESANLYVQSSVLAAGWHHVIVTYDGSKANTGLNIYIDGVLDNTRSSTGSYTAMEAGALDVLIGAETDLGNKFQDKIDNVMLFSKELSQGEVNYLYNNGDSTENLIKEPTDGAGVSADVPLLTGIEFIGNTGSGKAGWTGGTIDYAGVKYTIVSQAVDDGSTDEFIYWDADDGNTSFKTTGTLATAIAAGNWVVCVNASGVATPANVHKVLLGGLIQASTITATQIQVVNDSQVSIGEAFDSDTKLVLHFDGSDGATNTEDSSKSGHVETFVGTAQLDIAQKKFGTASLLLDGDSDYLTFLDHTDWDFGAGEFTIDAQVRFAVLPAAAARQKIIAQWETVGNERGWIFDLTNDAGTLKFRFAYSTDGSDTVVVSSDGLTLSVDTWYHICIVRDGDTLRFFLDGVAKGTGDLTGITINNSGDVLTVGSYLPSSATDFFDGWIDELRIIKGDAAWTSGFTPETEAYSGTTTYIDDWKTSGKTTIDGGKIKADSITADQMAAGSITAANAAIANLAVDTLQIAGLAVETAKIDDEATETVESSWTAADQNIGPSGTWEQIQSCSITSIGEAVETFGSFVGHYVGSGTAKWSIRIKYAGSVVAMYADPEARAYGNDAYMTVSYKHSPGSGSRSYTLEAMQIFTGTGNAYAKNRNMVITEGKGK